VSDSDERLRSIVASLEEFQEFLTGSANRDAAQLLGIAVLQLRMRIHQIADSELKALCDAMMVETNPDFPEASSGRVS
jgi:hypothetical protein